MKWGGGGLIRRKTQRNTPCIAPASSIYMFLLKDHNIIVYYLEFFYPFNYPVSTQISLFQITINFFGYNMLSNR